MSKRLRTQRTKAKRRQHRFAGEDMGRRVVAWMNDPTHSRTIEDLVVQLREKERLGTQQIGRGDFLGDLRRLEERVEGIDQGVNHDVFNRYVYRPFFDGFRPGGTPKQELVRHPISQADKEECDVFQDLWCLTDLALLHKFRTCDQCGKWLFARFPNGDRGQRFCGRICLNKWRTTDATYKEKRRQQQEEIRKAERKGVIFKNRR